MLKGFLHHYQFDPVEEMSKRCASGTVATYGPFQPPINILSLIFLKSVAAERHAVERRTLGFIDEVHARCFCAFCKTVSVLIGGEAFSKHESALAKPCLAAPCPEPTPLISLLSTYSCSSHSVFQK
jgi:hypothetical protein